MAIRRCVFGFLIVPLVLLAGCTGGAANGSSSEQSANSSSDSAVPGFVKGTLRATPLQQASPSSVADYPSAGVLLPKSDIVASAADSRQLHFGLAIDQEVTYPAISIDGGAIWQIDGPRFYVPAADASAVTSNVGSLGTHGAYFWGKGGALVKTTTDEGSHWWVTVFPAGVYEVSSSGGNLRTIALGNELRDGNFQAFLYDSTNSGRTWTLHGELASVRL